MEFTAKQKEKIIGQLFSANISIALEAIDNLRDIGNSSFLPDLIELLQLTNNNEIKTRIENLLYDLKDKSSVQYIVEAIQNERYKNIMVVLLTACWQNGLDYSPYLSTFVHVVIHENFQLAFESFTVIEQMPGPFSNDMINQIIMDLKENISQANEQKKYLFVELIEIVQKFQE